MPLVPMPGIGHNPETVHSISYCISQFSG